MSQKEKVLEVLALATLPEKAKIARLAAQNVGKPFYLEHALAVVRCYFPRGRQKVIAPLLMQEKHRQERIRNERQAIKRAIAESELPYTLRFSWAAGPESAGTRRHQERIRHAQNAFGKDIEENFGEDNLALMSLIQGDIRSYAVRWLDGSSRPVQSALIEVGVMVNERFAGQHRVLLYKHGRTMVAGTTADYVADAFAEQVPTKLVILSDDLRSQGCSITTDFTTQEMVITTPEGEVKRLPWTGQTTEG